MSLRERELLEPVVVASAGAAARGGLRTRVLGLAAALLLTGCAHPAQEPMTVSGAPTGDGQAGPSTALVTSPPAEDPQQTGMHPPEPSEPLLEFDAVGEGQVHDLRSRLPVQVDVVTQDQGSVLATTDPWGRPALLFPPFTDSPQPPRAVIRVTPDTSGPDPLAPGRSDFVFGADFGVDVESHGTEVDSGNNIIQRGLASDPSLFKLEVDARRPACRVQGPDGTVELRTQQRIQAERWYRVRCSRTGSTVTLSVFRVGGETATLVEQVRAEGSTGDLQWTAGTPLSIGGKLAANGVMIRTQTDQFNGLVAEPVFEIQS